MKINTNDLEINLIKYIQKTINEKNYTGDWDLGIDKSDVLLSMLMYEYSLSIKKLTGEKITAEQVIDKLADQMGKFRLGDFKTGKDDNITYDGISVTTEEYKKKCRIAAKFGAHSIEYKDNEGKSKIAVAVFNDRQVADIDGKKQKLSGIDLLDIADVRHTVFHEWTHIMERCMVKTSQLSREDIIFEDENSTFINSAIGPNLSIQEYKDYVSNVDKLLASDTEIPFGGISTIELGDDHRIMHNQISEGATEFIARKVMETIGETVKHPERYAEQTKIVGDIFTANGLESMIATYFTESHKIIRNLENKRVQNKSEDKDMLHFLSDYINAPRISKIFNKISIGKDGNVKQGFFTRLKDKFTKKEAKALPEGKMQIKETTESSETKRNEFIENLKVPDIEEPVKIIEIRENTEKEPEDLEH